MKETDVEAKKIGPEFARSLGRLEAEIYPPSFCLGWQDFQEDLEEAEAGNGNFSFGLFQEDRLTGYLVAYVKDGEIFISDLAILPECRVDRALATLLKTMFTAATERQLAITAECRENAYLMCIKHPLFFRRLGYELVHYCRVANYNGEPSWEVKFDCLKLK